MYLVLLEYFHHGSKGCCILYVIKFIDKILLTGAYYIMVIFRHKSLWYLPCLVGVCSSFSLYAL